MTPKNPRIKNETQQTAAQKKADDIVQKNQPKIHEYGSTDPLTENIKNSLRNSYKKDEIFNINSATSALNSVSSCDGNDFKRKYSIILDNIEHK